MRGSLFPDPISGYVHQREKTMGTPLTEEEFDRLGKELFNKRIGDFLYIYREPNPSWYYWRDIHDNSVMHGGDSTDAIIQIKEVHRSILEPRLMGYLRELVGRHNEQLHQFGVKKFHGVTIELPFDSSSGIKSDLRVTVHTGSGCCYDQGEIAYEAMAALSGVPALKAIAEPDSYYGFVRRDKINDNAWINYLNEELGIIVKFSYAKEDGSYVVISMYKGFEKNSEKFSALILDYIDEYVRSRTGKKIDRKIIDQEFKNENGGVTRICIGIHESSLYSFCVTVPCGGYVAFPRWEYARRAMEMLHKNFRK